MRVVTLTCGLVLAVAAVTPTQETHKPKPSATELIEQLGDAAFKVRRSAEKSLRELGTDAKEALEKAATDHGDAEVRWRAKRLLQQVESGGAGGSPRKGGLRERGKVGPEPSPERRGFGPGRDLDDVFDGPFRRLERDFDVDIPRHRFFQDDFFRDLRAQMDELRRGVGI